MKLALASVAAALLVVSPLAVRAEDLTGRWGVGVDAGWGGRLGSRVVRDTAGNGAALGFSVLYGVTPHWRGALNYENIDLRDKRFEPITASAIYSFFPDRRWTPFAELGLGGARAGRIPDSSSNDTALALKGAVGLEYALCPDLMASARAALYDAGHTSVAIAHEVDAATFGVGLSYWFGGHHRSAAASPAPAPAPAPVVAAAPVPAPAPAPAPTPAPKTVTISLDVQFETAKDAVRPQYDGKIAEVAEFLKAHPKAVAEIEGHTDNVGSEAYNTALSQRRADSVRRYMIEKKGVDGSRLTAKGYGPSKPIADNATAEGRATNRRVVATIDAQE